MGLKNSVNWMSLPLENRVSAPSFSPPSPAVTVRSRTEASMGQSDLLLGDKNTSHH